MDAKAILHRSLGTGLRLGRGAAHRVVTLAGPPLGRLTDRAVARLRGPAPASTTTFTPSRTAEPATEPEPEHQAEPAASPKGPSPASVARNIAPERPTARPARAAKPTSSPGAKLPPRRPATS